ncbi:serine hydrolase domain-containing protein [Mycobacterium camsae]|uniref:serine hydrolase domain-containing protein n=1 Tax=Mycobacterium gordonae TaxID=1778 RepID=UPI0019823C62|nr:serine hydrolase [Mycobacterium gordonae]
MASVFRWVTLPMLATLAFGACTDPHTPPIAAGGGATSATSTVKASTSQNVLDTAVKPDGPGCSAAVGVEGKVTWTGVAGLANLANGAKITAETVFDIGSVSKQFTATAVLLLAAAGKLSMDDALAQYLPEMPPWATNVTLTQLMHHTSGIPDYIGLLQQQGFSYADRTTEAQALQALVAAPELMFRPGTRFQYSNSNYLLLGEVVHRLSGKTLPDYLSAEIFTPLNLTMVMDPVARIPNKALSYTEPEGGADYQVADSKWEQVGDGGIQTTPSQLARWADNYRTGKVGGPNLLDAQLSGSVQTEPGGGDRYGAGIYSLANGMLDHDGAWAGFVTAFRVSSDRRTSVAVSCNNDTQDPEAVADALSRIWM